MSSTTQKMAFLSILEGRTSKNCTQKTKLYCTNSTPVITSTRKGKLCLKYSKTLQMSRSYYTSKKISNTESNGSAQCESFFKTSSFLHVALSSDLNETTQCMQHNAAM